MAHSCMDALIEHRSQFPALRNKLYLNYGGQGTMPQSSIDAIAKTYDHVQEVGPFHAAMFGWMVSEQDATRQALADELGGSAGSYALTQNVTEGCNIALWGIDWRDGDHLLTTDCEHVGVIHAVMQVQRRRNVELTFCALSGAKSKDEMVEIIDSAIAPRTRMVLISHVLWNTGQMLPVAEIATVCRRKNVLLLVDGAQSAGVAACDLGTEFGADFYSVTGHKWTCGPEGAGTFYVAPHALEFIQPTFVGWRGSSMDYKTGQPTGFTAGASRFEVGTGPIPILAGLRNSIAVHQAFGSPPQREELVLKNANRLIEKLSAIDRVECLLSKAESGLVSFRVEGANHRDVVGKLDALKIYVRTIPSPDCIRASVHYFTSDAEIDGLVTAIEEIMTSNRS